MATNLLFVKSYHHSSHIPNTMSNKGAKFSLKIVTNKQKTKVLFAEADSQFVDVLLSFLTLPLGKIVKVLASHYEDSCSAIGSLTTLYNSLADLDISNFEAEAGKRILLDPKSPSAAKCNLKININDYWVTRYFCCPDLSCDYSKKKNMSLYWGIATCGCGKPLTRKVPLRSDKMLSSNGGFVVSGSTFVISDDLMIMPNSPSSVLQILGNLSITDNDWDLKDVTIGYNEVMDLLRGLFLSRTPLTDIVISNGQINLAMQAQLIIPPPKVERKRTFDYSESIDLKVIMQKSTNKLLFAQADEVFIDFLFGLLMIPIGEVGRLLDCKTFLTNVHNLYLSANNLIDGNYIFDSENATSLVNPTLPHGYVSNNQILPLVEEEAGKMYYYQGPGTKNGDFMSDSPFIGGSCLKVTEFKFGSLFKGPRIYMVNDDLSVTPASSTSYLSNLGRLKIPLSDVTERVVRVGLEEAFNILKASLVSKHALSCAYTMSDPKNFRFTLKAMINKHKTRVLYVEADSDFADVLLSFLTLPLGTIVRVLKKHYGDEVPVLGSLTTLYNGLHNLDSGLFLSQDHKNLLLNPENLYEEKCRGLKIKVDDTKPTDYFKYRHDIDGIGGMFIRKVSLIITDDLQILPNCMGSAVKILHNSGIMDMIGIEEGNLSFGFNEIMDLLRGSLFSRAPLSALFLKKKLINYTAVKCETDGIQPVNLIQQQICDVKKLTVKAILQRSTNKLLFAEANYEFVGFLFSLLQLPLIEVECLLGSDTAIIYSSPSHG
ncbi:hypothetical protein STAS_30747 [Striga asiatica]|uniref:DUF674 family protein n=1 Tax=Striga asiatica TaxID=4170 RepID=A0A5A7R731_STRAF|nr:hypothetical protein STAS_30747 [Striga asiatica]